MCSKEFAGLGFVPALTNHASMLAQQCWHRSLSGLKGLNDC